MDVLGWPVGMVEVFADYQRRYMRKQKRKAAKRKGKR